MAGWRIGFMVRNKDLVYALSRIKGYHDYGTVHADPGRVDRRAARALRNASGHRAEVSKAA